jgi:hypothetical protein
VVEPGTTSVPELVNTAYRPLLDSEVMPESPLETPPPYARLASRVLFVDASRTKASDRPLVSPATSWPPLVVNATREPSPEITGGLL